MRNPLSYDPSHSPKPAPVMRVHILGICGTFMGGLALLARDIGFAVSGADSNVYPPMSTQLVETGIKLYDGYRAEDLDPRPDLIIVGNALSRGNPCVERMLDDGLAYTSGPQWLAEQVLQDRHVLAVSGTHGKTTTASLLAWILAEAGLQPGFLIGGLPVGFGHSARLGAGRHFVVEGDEYDTAFFDKRSKFIHYRPRTLIINNIELDHVDIFPDLEAVQRQFHHLIRTIPGQGLIVRPVPDAAVDAVLGMGCWTPQVSFGEGARGNWRCRALASDYHRFEVSLNGEALGEVAWRLFGAHNAHNALAALAAARHAGVAPTQGLAALASFPGVKRRLELLAVVAGVSVYDDFAHHPTEIASSVGALRQRAEAARIIAVFEPRSNTMRLGRYKEALAQCFGEADRVVFYRPPDLDWDLAAATEPLGQRRRVFETIEAIVAGLAAEASAGDHILVMSNGGFGGIHDKVIQALRTRSDN